MKRKLNEDEMKICAKSLINLSEEHEWASYQSEYCKLMLEKGLMENYKKNIRDFKRQKTDWEGTLRELEANIKILKEQMENGVEEKMKGGKK